MARKMESGALSTFFGSMATMLQAGIQVDEATLMLKDGRERSRLQHVCQQLYESVVAGDRLSDAMQKTGAFPRYAIDMISAGERAGHLEQVLRNLETYYDEEDRLIEKLRSSAGYPAALLVVMTVILAFTVAVILPVFADVYANMAGPLRSGSFTGVGLSIVIGWVSLIAMAVLAVIALALTTMTHFEHGLAAVIKLLTHAPFTRQAMYQLSLSRFMSALATLTSSGIDDKEAMKRAADTVEQPRLYRKLQRATESIGDVENPRSLVQAIAEFEIIEPLYARMLAVGTRSGQIDTTLRNISSAFFDDAVVQLDRALDNIEPLLSALLTIAVGATLIAVMLPLIGIMSSIG